MKLLLKPGKIFRISDGCPGFNYSATRGERTTGAPLAPLAAATSIEARVGAQGLFQVCVLRLGFLQDGDVGVGVFPESEEIFVGGECAGAGGIGVRSL